MALAELKQVLDGMKMHESVELAHRRWNRSGVGGKWRVVQTINANGLRLKQTSTHEITQLTEHGFSVDVTVTQDANPQEIKNDALPPTTKINLTSLKSTGNAKSTIVLDSVFPIRTTMTITSQTAMGIEAAGQNQDMTIDMKMELTLETLPYALPIAACPTWLYKRRRNRNANARLEQGSCWAVSSLSPGLVD